MTIALAAQRDHHIDQADNYRRQATLATDKNFAWRLKRDADREMGKANRLNHLASVLALASTAERIQWKPSTVWEEGSGGIDGNLYFYRGEEQVGSIPLDTYSINSSLAPACHDLSASGIGMAVTIGATKTAHHDAVRAWCELMLDRDDVEVSG